MKTKSPFFFPLVIGLFIIIVTTYIPVFATRITSIRKEITGNTHGTFDIVKHQFNATGFLSQEDSSVPIENKNTPLIERTENAIDAPTQEGLPSSTIRIVEEGTPRDPAKTFCVQKGGFVQEREGAAGSQYTACLFVDGSECETHQFLGNTCHIGQYRVAEDGMKKSTTKGNKKF